MFEGSLRRFIAGWCLLSSVPAQWAYGSIALMWIKHGYTNTITNTRIQSQLHLLINSQHTTFQCVWKMNCLSIHMWRMHILIGMCNSDDVDWILIRFLLSGQGQTCKMAVSQHNKWTGCWQILKVGFWRCCLITNTGLPYQFRVKIINYMCIKLLGVISHPCPNFINSLRPSDAYMRR